jgi:replicative DNA helicase
MQAEHTPTPYELAADDVIAVLLNEETALDKSVYEMGLLAAHMPTPQHKIAMEVITKLRQEKQVVHDTIVMDAAGGAVGLDWISQRWALYDVTRAGSVFEANVKLVREHGIRHGIQRVLNTGIAQLADGKKSTSVLIAQLMDILSTVHMDTSIKGETAAEIGKEFLAMMNSEPGSQLSTGFTWLDSIAGGFDRRHLWWIAGAYKGRKSTLMLNLILAGLMQGAEVGVLSREMPRIRVAAQMISMLAIAWLLREGLYMATDANGIPLNSISANSLTRAKQGYRKWDKRKVAAVDFGISEWNKFDKRLRIYDSMDGAGSLSDWSSVQRVVKRDKAMYGLDLLFVDYMQLFDAPGKSEHEQTAYLAKNFQRLTMREDITTIVLAQKNEDSIKNGQKSYSPGIKGGGDAAATADFMLVTSYKQTAESLETDLDVRMQLSRHGTGGADVVNTFDIHPASGLFLEANWITNMKKQGAA